MDHPHAGTHYPRSVGEFQAGSGLMQTAWTTWNGYAGPPALSARPADTMAAGSWATVVSFAPGAVAVAR